MLALGTNNNVFATYKVYLDAAISRIKENGQIPVLVTVTPRPDAEGSTAYADFRVAANSYIRALGERYVDMNLAVDGGRR